ncbi:MAG: DUF4810 domain-containing protein [Verrucomicrobia bacterium]|jgi:hypothetical protein|nr:DUF4810 domain-containing protein [Verrucomicrobiota bacterium]
MLRLVLGLPVAALLAGCTAPSLYSWGHYEEVIYTSYRAPDKAPPERQIEVLEADFQKAQAHGKAVPPGFHAHLGYLYYETGHLDAARHEFETEKALFPESTVFMDRLLINLTAVEGK